MLTAKRLRTVLHYDPSTGIWRWTVQKGNAYPPGTVAGGIHKVVGYHYIMIDGQTYFGHRLAWLYMTGKWPELDIDHIDGDVSNNRWTNLRLATKSQNKANSKRYKNNTTGYKGVTKVRDKWRAYIAVDKKRIWLGYYKTPEDASDAYQKAATKYFGEFARGE